MKFRESLVSHNLARFLVPATRFTSAKGPTRGTGLALFRDARVNRSAPNERGFGAFVSRSDREGGTRARRDSARSRRGARAPVGTAREGRLGTVGAAQQEVVVAMVGRHVNEARAAVGGDEIARQKGARLRVEPAEMVHRVVGNGAR